MKNYKNSESRKTSQVLLNEVMSSGFNYLENLNYLMESIKKKRKIKNKQKKDWEIVRDQLKTENEVIFYAVYLDREKGILFFDAIDAAEKEIVKLRKETNEKYPGIDPESINKWEKYYYSRLMKMFSS